LLGGLPRQAWARAMSLRHLVVVLGDQLDRESTALDGLDPARDRLWMAEVPSEAEHVWSHKARIALFLAAMRHHADWLRGQGWPLDYLALDAHEHRTLGEALMAALMQYRPQAVVLVQPGDSRVLADLQRACDHAGVTLQLRPDRRFIVDPQDFARWAAGRKRLVLEHFYRFMRKRTGYLMEGKLPAGGRWNFDADNRPPGAGIAAGAAALRTGRGDCRGAAAGGGTLRRAPGRAVAIRLAGDPRPGPSGPRGFHRAAAGAVRPLPGRHVARRALAVPCAPVSGTEPEAA
jgi:hypothetical protein